MDPSGLLAVSVPCVDSKDISIGAGCGIKEDEGGGGGGGTYGGSGNQSKGDGGFGGGGGSIAGGTNPIAVTDGSGNAPPAQSDNEPHYFLITRTTLCSADGNFAIARFPGVSAPLAPFARAGTNRINLYGDNPIEQKVDINERTIVNTTLEGHQFHPGSVTWTFTDTNIGSIITIEGVGTGPEPENNEFIGRSFFGSMASMVAGMCIQGPSPYFPY